MCCGVMRCSAAVRFLTRSASSARFATKGCLTGLAAITASVCQSGPRPALAPECLVDAPRDRAGTDRAGRPEQNGSHEQFHAVLKADTARPPAAHCRAQQQRFRRFCRDVRTQGAAARESRRSSARDGLSGLGALAARARAAGRVCRASGDSARRRAMAASGWRGRPLFLH